MKKLSLFIITCALVLLSGCSLLQAFALKDCDYSYDKLTDVSFMNMTTSELLSFSGAAKMASGLLGKTETVPLGFTIHLKVNNPNQRTASMERLYYKVSLDSVEVADGNTTEPFMVAGGTTADLPLRLNLDVKNLLQSDKRAVLTKTIKNFVGVNAEPTNVTVQLKPTINMGGTPITSPAYIPIKFQYTGKNGK